MQDKWETYDLENRQAEHIIDRYYAIFIAETNIDGLPLYFSVLWSCAFMTFNSYEYAISRQEGKDNRYPLECQPTINYTTHMLSLEKQDIENVNCRVFLLESECCFLKTRCVSS